MSRNPAYSPAEALLKRLASTPWNMLSPAFFAAIPREKATARVEVAKATSEGFENQQTKKTVKLKNGALPNNEPPRQTPIVKKEKVGRNDPCPCGSGKKYKKCCGASQSELSDNE